MASKKTQQLKKAKEHRQKRIAIGGAVLLVLVLVIQVPRTMHRLHPKSTAPAAASTTTSPDTSATGTPAAASGSTSGMSTDGTAAAASNGQAAATSPAVLADSDVPLKPGRGKLVVFDRFESKDPFVQQVSDDQSTSGGASAPAGTAQTPLPQTSSTTVLRPVTGAKTASSRNSIVISTNGVSEPVAVGSTFPSQDATFRLVSVTASGAQIAVAGGSYADGSATVTLVKGKPLTLMNTRTGARYRLVYVSPS